MLDVDPYFIDILKECHELVEKCKKKGFFARAYAGTVQKNKYVKKFGDLEKRLQNLNLPAGLASMVSYVGLALLE